MTHIPNLIIDLYLSNKHVDICAKLGFVFFIGFLVMVNDSVKLSKYRIFVKINRNINSDIILFLIYVRILVILYEENQS